MGRYFSEMHRVPFSQSTTHVSIHGYRVLVFAGNIYIVAYTTGMCLPLYLIIYVFLVGPLKLRIFGHARFGNFPKASHFRTCEVW